MPDSKQFFEDTFRPAKLLLDVYRLLENEGVETDHDWIRLLRPLIGAQAEEELLLIWNGIFLGVVTEAAAVRRNVLRKEVLKNLLRQSVVCASTAMETYLQVLLEEHLTEAIRLRGAELWPRGDAEVTDYFKGFSVDLDGALNLVAGDADPFGTLARKLLHYFKYKNLGSDKSVKTVGILLGLNQPWRQIALHLGRNEKELTQLLRSCVERRNDIVHRGDRTRGEEAGPRQDLSYAWSKQAVETVENICLTIGELVESRLAELRAMQPDPDPPRETPFQPGEQRSRLTLVQGKAQVEAGGEANKASHGTGNKGSVEA